MLLKRRKPALYFGLGLKGIVVNFGLGAHIDGPKLVFVLLKGHQNDFGNCIRSADLVPIHYTGLRHTWHNSQGINTIQKKLDWSFGNAALLLKWKDAHTIFLPRSISDHSPGITLLSRPVIKLHPPFKFLNLWADKEEFLPMVASTWQQEVDGHPFLQLIQKLRLVKAQLKKFHQLHYSHITRRVNNAKDNWEKAQIDLDTNPSNAGLRLQERRETVTPNSSTDPYYTGEAET
ncbi:hypothetical protein OIU77_027765 [Salix suchowensis]|uniref:Uncharacterized protein n=1 Tax=Salix suchowensis TaxID=1278906 RepID=A0ABQ9BQU1_9ROSI|nr:hypothetical protein OIU77_027765 [Salix suchowensis]